jgi:hypothetical protein
MIITDLPCFEVIPDQDQVMGGKKIKFSDFKKLWGDKSMASISVFAEGDEVWTSFETSVCKDGSSKSVSSTISHSQD